jgi:hypothetical protein
MNATYTAYAESDLYSAGHSCDGHPFIAERFYVVIENAAGRRFRHQASFNGAERFVCEETGEPHFADLREEASAKAERLAARVNAALVAGLALDSALWYEIDPAYGSDEYQSQGIEAQRAFADRAAI